MSHKPSDQYAGSPTGSYPPDPPEIRRAIRLNPLQRIGVPLLLLLPLLTVLGFWGVSMEQISASAEGVAIRVDYPARTRFNLDTPIVIAVQNTAAQTASIITVRLDHTFLGAFTVGSVLPGVDRLSNTGMEIDLRDVQPSETRQIHLQLRANRYGLSEGTLAVSSPGGPTARARLSTFVFP